jgi:hypothetical protein
MIHAEEYTSNRSIFKRAKSGSKTFAYTNAIEMMSDAVYVYPTQFDGMQ